MTLSPKQSIELDSLGVRVLASEFIEAKRIAISYPSRKPKNRRERELRVEIVKNVFELDRMVGIPVPTHTRYPVEYRAIIRPIHYYCKDDLEHGIKHTRTFVSNTCAHLEGCVKHCLLKLDPTFKSKLPLGPMAYQLKRLHDEKRTTITLETIQNIITVNSLVYTKAKHDWDIEPETHLFSLSQAIIVYFIIRKLAKTLVDQSGLNFDLNSVTSP